METLPFVSIMITVKHILPLPWSKCKERREFFVEGHDLVRLADALDNQLHPGDASHFNLVLNSEVVQTGPAAFQPPAPGLQFLHVLHQSPGAGTELDSGIEEVNGAGILGLGKGIDRKSTRLNSSHVRISYAVFCLKKKKKIHK